MQDNNSETTEQKINKVSSEIREIMIKNNLIGMFFCGSIKDIHIPDEQPQKEFKSAYSFVVDSSYSGIELKDKKEMTIINREKANDVKNAFVYMGNVINILITKLLQL